MVVASHRTHPYRASCVWSGSTGRGYDEYVRAHDGTCPPAGAAVRLSGDPAFRGDAALLNPEQLLVLSAASCQLLSFLAIAARARVDVRDYRDDADAVMTEDGRGGGRFTSITLRPHITVVASAPAVAEVSVVEERLRRLVRLAHEQCFIAATLNCPVTVEPTFEILAPYAFGDSEPAARRLGLLADVFGAASRGFLARHSGPERPALAVDLGCGPGHTTRMLAETVGAAATVGLDTSPSFLSAAASVDKPPAGVAFEAHDVRRTPFPPSARGADVAYARFLLAHLTDVAGTVSAWCGQLAPGGLLLLEDADAIDTEVSALREYLELAERLLAGRGATIYAGGRLTGALGEIAERAPAVVVEDTTVRVPVTAARAAEMFALNLAVWRADPLLRDDQPRLDRLAADLEALREATSATSATSAITWTLRRVALRHR